MNETDAPPEWAMKHAAKIAAKIAVEHDDTMQAQCRVCQRVIPFITQALAAARAQGWRDAIEALRETNYNHMVDGPKTTLHQMREHAALWLEANTDLQHALADAGAAQADKRS